MQTNLFRISMPVYQDEDKHLSLVDIMEGGLEYIGDGSGVIEDLERRLRSSERRFALLLQHLLDQGLLNPDEVCTVVNCAGACHIEPVEFTNG